MQSMRQLKDTLKALPKAEQKEILNKKRLEIKQSRTKRNRREKLNKKINSLNKSDNKDKTQTAELLHGKYCKKNK